MFSRGRDRRRCASIDRQDRVLGPPEVPWSTDADGGEALLEFAGRACYQAGPSQPAHRHQRRLPQAHHRRRPLLVLEHASVSFYVTGISRSCTHELIRHRHFSYSQLSQRYVPENEAEVGHPAGPRGRPRAAADPARRGRRQPRRLRRTAGQAGSQVRRPAQRRAAPQAGPPGRPRGPARTTPKPASSSPATTAPGDTSSPCAPASTPMSRSAAWQSPACASWRRSHRVFADFENHRTRGRQRGGNVAAGD